MRIHPSLPLHGFARQCTASTRALAPAPPSQPDCARWTEQVVSLCALCLGLVLDGASCFVILPTCLGHCFSHGFRARDQVSRDDGGGQFPRFCRVDPRQSGQHVDQTSKNISLGASVGHRLACCPTALPCEAASSDLRLPQAGISKSNLENVTQVIGQVLLKL